MVSSRVLALAALVASFPAAAEGPPSASTPTGLAARPARPIVSASPTPAPTPVATAGTTTVVASAQRPARPRFRAEPFLLEAHLGAGIEPHGFACNTAVSVTCRMPAFNVGGSMLWRGLVGPSLGLWASEGSPMVTADAAAQTSFGDRISATLAIEIRPLSTIAWRHGDTWLARFAGGVALELGPSLEYLRTSSVAIADCSIPTSKSQAGLHSAASFELPLLGNARMGWLALRTTVRVIVNSEAHLAPLATEGGCRALVVMPPISSQLLFGLAYSL